MTTTSALVAECHRCEEPIASEPVRDDTEVFWVGVANARTWCSEDCMQASSEAYWMGRTASD